MIGLQQLQDQPDLSAGLEIANAIIGLLGLPVIPVDKIRKTVVDLPNAERYDRWFNKHPIFVGRRGCFALSSNDLIETKFYHLQKHSRQIVAGSVNFELNFEDENFTRKGEFKIGLDFFLLPDNKSLQVVLSNYGKLRIVELSDRLTQTQVDIFSQWAEKASGCSTKADLHDILWSSFGLKSVNQKFYDGIAHSFSILLEHLRDTGKEEEEAKLFASRLLGRLLFCWFLRKKGIISAEEDYFKVGDMDSTTYYRLKLESLFFFTLNTPISERQPFKDRGQTYLISPLIEQMHLWSQIDVTTPYLNGGLFDPARQ